MIYATMYVPGTQSICRDHDAHTKHGLEQLIYASIYVRLASRIHATIKYMLT